MSVLIFAEHVDGKFHKPAFELSTYAADLAKNLGTDAFALVTGKIDEEELKKLGRYGIKQVLYVNDPRLEAFNSSAYAKAFGQAADKLNANVILFSSSFNGRAIAPRLSARLKAGLISGALGQPDLSNGFTVKKSVYSGKGFGYFAVPSEKKILTIGINSYHVSEAPAEVKTEAFSPAFEEKDFPVSVVETHRKKGKVSLAEAEVVVSGGRGMKGPENWPQLEELADILGAATACSKPVADVGWRPHEEHVGQTGLTISPNLYIALGISGAIQHLAGVSGSKIIVAVNKDKEAPFFKAADYGIIGDVFEVLPKLIAEAKKIKSA